MPWDDTARAEHTRKTNRYPSDMTDAEWVLIEPLLPPARHGGRPRTTDMRAVTDAILYIGSTGCQWRALPGAGQWRVREDQPTHGEGGAATGRPPAGPDRRSDRQPERENHRKRRGSRL